MTDISDEDIKELLAAAKDIEENGTYSSYTPDEIEMMDREFLRAEKMDYTERELTEEEMREVEKHLLFWKKLLRERNA